MQAFARVEIVDKKKRQMVFCDQKFQAIRHRTIEGNDVEQFIFFMGHSISSLFHFERFMTDTLLKKSNPKDTLICQ